MQAAWDEAAVRNALDTACNWSAFPKELLRKVAGTLPATEAAASNNQVRAHVPTRLNISTCLVGTLASLRS